MGLEGFRVWGLEFRVLGVGFSFGFKGVGLPGFLVEGFWVKGEVQGCLVQGVGEKRKRDPTILGSRDWRWVRSYSACRPPSFSRT